MTFQALTFVSKNTSLFDNFKDEHSTLQAAIDNDDLINILQDEVTGIQEIGDQETYVWGDGSYLTRNGVEYWIGKDVDDFEAQYK